MRLIKAAARRDGGFCGGGAQCAKRVKAILPSAFITNKTLGLSNLIRCNALKPQWVSKRRPSRRIGAALFWRQSWSALSAQSAAVAARSANKRGGNQAALCPMKTNLRWLLLALGGFARRESG